MLNVDAWVGLLDSNGNLVFDRQLVTFVNGVSQTRLSYVVKSPVRIEGFDVAKSSLGPALMFGKLTMPVHANLHDTVEMCSGSITLDFGGLNTDAVFDKVSSDHSPDISWDDKTVVPVYSTPYPELEKWAEETGNYFRDM
jgi:hypothetical protein